jgi:uncharacterized membrane protein
MALLSQAKTLGGIGSILVLLTLVPYVGVVLGIVGFILILIAVKYVSDSVGNRSIFNNMIISVILSIVGIIVGGLVVFASIFRYIGMGSLSGFPWGPNSSPPPLTGDMIGFIMSIITGLLLIWIFLLISAIFLRMSYNSIAAKLNVGMFRTTGLIYLIGAALTIVLVGLVLILVAEILQIIAFFSIPEQTAS